MRQTLDGKDNSNNWEEGLLGMRPKITLQREVYLFQEDNGDDTSGTDK